MTDDVPGRWIGYFVDHHGNVHQLSDEENSHDACIVAGRRWRELGSPTFRTFGEAHISQIPRIQAEHQEHTP